jgi:hypothetical protein
MHADAAPPSSAQTNVAPVSLSENENVASVDALVPEGADVIVGAGGATVSTVQDRLAGERSVLPARSRARTLNVCVPSARLP